MTFGIDFLSLAMTSAARAYAGGERIHVRLTTELLVLAMSYCKPLGGLGDGEGGYR